MDLVTCRPTQLPAEVRMEEVPESRVTDILLFFFFLNPFPEKCVHIIIINNLFLSRSPIRDILSPLPFSPCPYGVYVTHCPVRFTFFFSPFLLLRFFFRPFASLAISYVRFATESSCARHKPSWLFVGRR